MMKTLSEQVKLAVNRVLCSLFDCEDRERIADGICTEFEHIALNEAKGEHNIVYPLPTPGEDGRFSTEQLLIHRHAYARMYMRRALDVVKSGWELEKIIPDGWTLYSADFSLQATGKGEEGAVLLYCAETDTFASGHGVTMREAVSTAVASISEPQQVA